MGKSRSPEEKAALARKRAELIIQVRSRAMTATEAAHQLGVSRKTYYEWEQRGLESLVNAVSDAPDGRPPVPVNAQNEALKKRVEELEDRERVLEQKLIIQRVLLEAETEAEKKRGQDRERGTNGRTA